jgi:hypothetical protein
MKETPYFKQAQLMLRVMPHVAAEECFALKGGTAINFYVRDMPRLSVDIDLTYVPLEPRDTALANIGEALHRYRRCNSKDRAWDDCAGRPGKRGRACFQVICQHGGGHYQDRAQFGASGYSILA